LLISLHSLLYLILAPTPSLSLSFSSSLDHLFHRHRQV
jgi:hypothetical protein